MRFVFVVLFLTPCSLQVYAQTPSPSPPAYQQQRYDEDWSYLKDPEKRTDPLDRLKYIPLNDRGWYVSLGGEARWRYEYFSEYPSFLLESPGDQIKREPEKLDAYLLDSATAFVHSPAT